MRNFSNFEKFFSTYVLASEMTYNVLSRDVKQSCIQTQVRFLTLRNATSKYGHKILMRDLVVFRLVCVIRLMDFNAICQNEGDGGSPNAD